MRTLLSIACLVAVSQAVRTNAAQGCCNHSSGNSNSKCNPCDPSPERFNADTDHKKKDEIDVSKDFLKDFAAVGDELIHQSKVDGILRAALNIDIAKDIEAHILKPILDAKVGEMIPVKKIADVIADLNKEDEKIKVVDDLPAVDVVVKKEIEDAKQKDEGVEFHSGITSDPKDFDNATVEKLDTPNGEVMLITIPHGIDGKTVEEVPVDEIGDMADDAAKDMVDDLAEGETPAVESESESEPEELPAPTEPVKPAPATVEEPTDVLPEPSVAPATEESLPEPLIIEEKPEELEDEEPRVCEKHLVGSQVFDLT